MSVVGTVRPGCVQLQGETLNLARFERRPGELLLAKDLSARHLINIVGARLIRANEIELAVVDGTLEVIGVDPTSRPVLRRILPRMLAQKIPAKAIVDWESIQPFVAHVPTSGLRIPYRKLARLHPAQIADLVEAASHEEGEEIINGSARTLSSRRTFSRSSTLSTSSSSCPLARTKRQPVSSPRWPQTTPPI